MSLGTPVARVSRTGNSIASLEYEFHGLANNTLAAVDASGAVNASLSYSPFGALLETTDEGGASGVVAHPRRFNDKYLDSISGLAYYGARYYDKTLLAWTQSDAAYRFAPHRAFAEPRRANLYTFSLSNPMQYIDPDGRDVVVVGTNVAKMKDVVTAAQGIVKDAGTIQGSVDKKNGVIHLKFAPSKSHKEMSTSQSKFIGLMGNHSKVVAVQNVREGLAKDASEKKTDAALRAKSDTGPDGVGQGGAMTLKSKSGGQSLDGAPVAGIVVMDFGHLTKEVAKYGDSSQTVPETPSSILYHEAECHADDDNLDGTDEAEEHARDCENREIRKDQDMGARDQRVSHTAE